ncbi:hypothetical protein GMLC_20770 [Geomonas limicola]|uniref:Glycosyltransferase n=1 Tax=Geomonas limicola TaxID=2740186 RepID=A0A6V8N7G2_9BACT|nr:hypothetical protein GMLC_20770 [Geomonas limicola]
MVHLATTDFGGAGKAAYRLHRGLLAQGVDSTMLVVNRKNDDPTVRLIPSGQVGGIVECPESYPPNQEYAHRIWRHWQENVARYPDSPPGIEIFSDDHSEIALECSRELQEADIVNLHWVAGLVNWVNAARALKGKRIVWTMHDMNPLTGGCHYSGACTRYLESCGACPMLGSTEEDDLSRSIWQYKRFGYGKLDITPVAPSRWLAELARKSALLSRFESRVIANGIPSDVFHPGARRDEVRASYGIPQGAKVVLFGAESLLTERKGFGYLLHAIKGMRSEGIVFAFFGKLPKEVEQQLNLPLVNVGFLEDEAALAAVYAMADLFVIPSVEDNLPNTVVEAMLCGVPVVGFDIGGIPDMVEHQKTGYLVRPRDVAGLVQGIQWCLFHPDAVGLSAHCRKRALEKYRLEVQAQNYTALYRELLAAPAELAAHATATAQQTPEPAAPAAPQGAAPAHPAELPGEKPSYLVSAIVSCYASERFLRGKLEDLEAQTIADRLEIIVIDSGSPENEAAIVAEFQGRYQNIRYLRTERRETVYQAWNRGLRMATGEFVCNANTDDRLRPDAYQVLVQALREHPECVLAYPNHQVTRRENLRFGEQEPDGLQTWSSCDRFSLLELCCIGPFPLWRRSLHEEIGYFDERYQSAADFEFWLRAAASHRFLHVPEYLGLYWLSEQTVSRKGELPTLEYLQVQRSYLERFAPLAPQPTPLPAPAAERLAALDRAPAGAERLTQLAGILTEYPDCAAAHLAAARCLVDQGESVEAKRHFLKAALLEPRSPEYTRALDDFLARQLDPALEHYRGTPPPGADAVNYRLSAGLILLIQGDAAGAADQFRAALELDPENAPARGHLAALEAPAVAGPECRDAESATGYFGFRRPEVQRLVSRRARRVLDIGCAQGRVGSGIRERQGAEVWGVEADPNAAALAARVLDRVIPLPVEAALAELPNGYFDSIILADVLEHLADPAAVLAGLVGKLTAHGELVVSLPNVAHWSVLEGLLNGEWDYQDAGILDRTHLRFFTRKSALRLFEAVGLSATRCIPIALSGLAGIPAPLAAVLAASGNAGPELAEESQAYQYLFRLVRPESRLTSIVILTFNELECTRECLESIARHTPEPHEIILVDNGSTDGTLPYLRELCAVTPNYRLVENGRNLGFAAGCNVGMHLARGGRILLLNNDVLVTHGWLSGMLECLEREPQAGLAGPLSNEVAGAQRIAASSYPGVEKLDAFAREFARAHRGRRIPVDRLVGFCLLMDRSVLDAIGGLDESFGSGNFEDDDYCLRAALAGYSCVIAGDVFIHHHGSRSFSANRIDYARAMAENRARFDAKWELGRLDEELAKQLVTHNAMVRGRQLARQGKPGRAVELLLEQGIRFSPANRAPYRVLAGILCEAGRHQDAMEVLEQLPGSSQPADLLLAARCHRGLGQGARAGELVEAALERDPEAPAALNVKSELALERGDRAAAGELFQACLAADPGFAPGYGGLSLIAEANGAREEAFSLAELAFALAPDSVPALARLHDLAQQLDRLEVEETRLAAARTLYPDHLGLTYGAVELALNRGRFPEAMALIEEAAARFGMDDGLIDAALAVRSRLGVKKPEPGKGLLSLCLIVKDEAANLPTLLYSVRSLADEIVVVDTGSCDRSADIARVFGARLHEFPWSGDFSAARNVSLDQASCPWILVLDADEALAKRDLAALRTLVKEASGPVAYSFTTRNYTDAVARKNWCANAGAYPDEERGRGWTPSDKVRLFPNDARVRFRGKVHELLEPSLAECGIPVIACPVPVHHYGRLDQERTRQKQEQYYRLGLEKLAEGGADAAALLELARQATELHHQGEARELWYRLIALDPGDAEAHFNLGYLHLTAGEYATAWEHARRAVAMAPQLKEAAFNLAKCELFLGRTQDAFTRCQEMLRTWPGHPPALSLYAALCLVLGMDHEAETSIDQLAGQGYGRVDYLEEYAQGLVAGGAPELAAPLLARLGAPKEAVSKGASRAAC